MRVEHPDTRNHVVVIAFIGAIIGESEYRKRPIDELAILARKGRIDPPNPRLPQYVGPEYCDLLPTYTVETEGNILTTEELAQRVKIPKTGGFQSTTLAPLRRDSCGKFTRYTAFLLEYSLALGLSTTLGNGHFVPITESEVVRLLDMEREDRERIRNEREKPMFMRGKDGRRISVGKGGFSMIFPTPLSMGSGYPPTLQLGLRFDEDFLKFARNAASKFRHHLEKEKSQAWQRIDERLKKVVIQ